MPEAKLDPVAVTVAEAAVMLRMSRSAVYLAISKGRLKAVKVNSQTLVPVSFIHEFLASLPVHQPAAARTCVTA
jgi:excisionase family DNA binding protein